MACTMYMYGGRSAGYCFQDNVEWSDKCTIHNLKSCRHSAIYTVYIYVSTLHVHQQQVSIHIPDWQFYCNLGSNFPTASRPLHSTLHCP